jgi:hypothetical protein
VSVSYRDLTRQADFQRLLIELSRRPASGKRTRLDVSVPLINLESYEQLLPGVQSYSPQLCYCVALETLSRSICDDTAAARRRPRFPLAKVLHVFIHEEFSGQLPSSALLRNPTMGLHVKIFTYINLIYQDLEFATVTTIQSIKYNNFTFCMGVHTDPGRSRLNGFHFINLLGSLSHFCL